MTVLLTGIAGTGKSTLTKNLNDKGIQAIDLHDIPGVFVWKNITTRETIEYHPSNPHTWFETADRVCDIERLEQVMNENPTAIFAGSTGGSNLREFLSKFDTVILLQCNPETIRHRMKTRTNKSGFGKTKEEQDDNIDWQREFDSELLSLGAIPVNTEGVIDDVIQKITSLI